MVTSKFYVGLIFVVLTLGMLMLNSTLTDPVDSKTNYNFYFDQWRPNNTTMTSATCDCHVVTGNSATVIYGQGTIDVQGPTTIDALTQFDLAFKTSGFTNAQSNQITFGFNRIDNDNALFTSNQTDYKTGISIDTSGNSNYVNFTLTSPITPGNYSINLYTVYGKSGADFYYLNKTVDITVTQVVDTIPPVIHSVFVNNEPYTSGMQIRGNTSIEANVTDDYLSSVQYTIDNSTYNQMTLNGTSGLYQAYVDTSAISGTSTVLTILALDKGGNNATDSLYLLLNNTGLLPSTDIITYKVDQSIVMNDQKVDPIWAEVSETHVAEFGTNGFIKTVQDGKYIYTLLAYDSSYSWIAIDFNVNSSSELMAKDTDAWVFGTYGSAPYYGDYYFTGLNILPNKDKINDVFYEVIPQTDGYTYIETARLLDTGDSAGHDFIFSTGQTFNVAFASSADHLGTHQILSWAVTNVAPGSGNPNPTTPANLASSLNLGQISDFVFVLSVGIVVVTVLMHIALRVVSRPITHEKRIIYTNKIPNQPTSISVIKNFIFKSKKKISEEKK